LSVKIAIACGGSGGHFFPGFAVGRALKARFKDIQVLFITSSNSRAAFEDLVRNEGFLFKCIPAGPMPCGFSIKYASFFIKFLLSIFSSLKILRDFRPDVVVGFGSYASGPVVLAAWLMKIKSLVHEQNFIPGRANRLCSRFATKIAVSFEQTIGQLPSSVAEKCIFTGNPVRPEVLNADRNKALSALGLKDDKFTVLVMGGSAGAHSINKVMMESLPHICDKDNLQFIHLTGEADFDSVTSEYKRANVANKVLPYLKQMGQAYAVSDLVVARSGATTIAELTCMGLPAVLVPYPHAGGHQRKNAQFLSDRKAVYLLEDKDLSSGKLTEMLLSLEKDTQQLEEMKRHSRKLGRPEAVKDLVDEILKLC